MDPRLDVGLPVWRWVTLLLCALILWQVNIKAHNDDFLSQFHLKHYQAYIELASSTARVTLCQRAGIYVTDRQGKIMFEPEPDIKYSILIGSTQVYCSAGINKNSHLLIRLFIHINRFSSGLSTE